ncbi:MAG: M23 family metallopeptidase [Verrucomicrobiales bacterium]|nr:M23 family metallopeptidase [Verrucomicrobiales bacterium]
MKRVWPGIGCGLALWLGTPDLGAQPFYMPTRNRALFERGGAERFFVGTTGKPWTSGMFGCTRSSGGQFHEGLDIRCKERDSQGEPADEILSTADGVVVHATTNPALSNYGNYLIVRHRIDGLEVYSLYAHLSRVRDGISAGRSVRAGEVLGIMGRTANTREQITRDRAHLHFEIGLRVSDHYVAWQQKHYPGQRNDHGEFNGRNFLGLDFVEIIREQAARGKDFDLVRFLREQPELCRVVVRDTGFSWLRRYAALLERNPVAEREGVAGYELRLNYVGLPCRVIPRAPSELDSKSRIRLISVNEAEQREHPCRKLVTRSGSQWKLTRTGELLLDLLLQ